MWYKQPAQNHFEALPLGNGKLGAMIFGGIAKEQITLNQDTLWSGYADRQYPVIESRKYLDQVRSLIMEGKIHEAQQLADSKMLGHWSESYMPMGTLYLSFDQHSHADEYRLNLDLDTGVASVDYRIEGVGYRRRCFVSYPDGVMVLHLQADRKQMLSFDFTADSLLRHQVRTSDDCLIMEGQCPDHVEPNYVSNVPTPVVYEQDPKGMLFVVTACVKADESAVVSAEDSSVRVSNATECMIVLASENSFESDDCFSDAMKRMRKAADQAYEVLYRRHIKDFSEVYQRNVLYLGEAPDLPMNERLRLFKEENRSDPALYADYYNYGRYLLISSARQGVPANLQGIWSWELRPAWSANWTTNINIQMNYWLAESCNLSELHMTLVNWLEKLTESGTKTASSLYGCRGYCIHHNVDIWGMTTPAAEDSQFSLWPMAGVWIASHVWQHYIYTNDRDFLEKKAFPLLEGCAEFCCDWLVKNANGIYITVPSTSPENGFYDVQGRRKNLCCSSAMDITLIREMLTVYLSACDILDRQGSCYFDAQEKLAKLDDIRLTFDGRIAEWHEDYSEVDSGHRHLSHLYGVYPGNSFYGEKRLWSAAEKSLRKRAEDGSGTVGWSAAWIAALFAQFQDVRQAIKFLDILIGYSAPNLFDVYNDSKAPFVAADTYVVRGDTPEIGWFQIDGNFGGTAAIVEFLLQTADRQIILLPCLPTQWKSGRVTGLCAPGDVQFSIAWEKDGSVRVRMLTGKQFDPELPLVIRCRDIEIVSCYQRASEYTFVL